MESMPSMNSGRRPDCAVAEVDFKHVKVFSLDDGEGGKTRVPAGCR